MYHVTHAKLVILVRTVILLRLVEAVLLVSLVMFVRIVILHIFVVGYARNVIVVRLYTLVVRVIRVILA